MRPVMVLMIILALLMVAAPALADEPWDQEKADQALRIAELELEIRQARQTQTAVYIGAGLVAVTAVMIIVAHIMDLPIPEPPDTGGLIILW